MAARVIVSKHDSIVQVFEMTGKLLAQYPCTTGSEHDPLPIGDWKVTAVYKNPKFHYSPNLFWDAQATDSQATIAPGPRNPVGVVWIDLSKEHYGIHGTPGPGNEGHAGQPRGIAARAFGFDSISRSKSCRATTPTGTDPHKTGIL